MIIQIGILILLGIIVILLGFLLYYAKTFYPGIRTQAPIERQSPVPRTDLPKSPSVAVQKPSYTGYLQSDSWKQLREAAIQRANSKCELCGAPYKAVHHIKYPSNYAHDALENLIVVCGKCHEKLHGGREDIQGEAQQELLAEKVITRTRTYFFDVKHTSSDEKYVQITEAKKRENDVYEYYRIMIFEEEIVKFYQGFQNVLTNFKKDASP